MGFRGPPVPPKLYGKGTRSCIPVLFLKKVFGSQQILKGIYKQKR